MKFICKLLSMTLLIWFTLCWNPSSAVEEQYASNDNTLNYILQNVSSTVNDKENDDILPSCGSIQGGGALNNVEEDFTEN